MSILRTLKNMGIDLKSKDMYKSNLSPVSATELVRGESAAPVKYFKTVQEADFVLPRTYTCPLCGEKFKSLSVKSNRSRVAGSDIDLRPIHEPLDALKYSVIHCPVCGYSALQKYFDTLTQRQKKSLSEKKLKGFERKPQWQNKEVYTYDDAIYQYGLALSTAILKDARSSEKAYTCLMMAWVIRGKAELIKRVDPSDKKDLDDCFSAEKELIECACNGFLDARATEGYPMCGYDEYTIDYILSALLYECGKYQDSMKLLSELIVANGPGDRLKDRARHLKELAKEKLETT